MWCKAKGKSKKAKARLRLLPFYSWVEIIALFERSLPREKLPDFRGTIHVESRSSIICRPRTF